MTPRCRDASKQAVGAGFASRHGLLHDVRRVDDRARLLRDSHVGHRQQAHLHHQATGEMRSSVRNLIQGGFLEVPVHVHACYTYLRAEQLQK